MGKHSNVREAPRRGGNNRRQTRGGQSQNRNMGQNGKVKMKAWKKVLIALVLILVVLAGCGFGYIQSKLGKINFVELNEEELGISDNVSKGFRNIALLAVDSRNLKTNDGSRSDGLIVCSINENTKEIRLMSIYRDTYVQVEGHGLTKITHAYAYGGPQLAVKTLNTNLDLNISEFVTVNFDAVIAAVDALGGITIDIEDYEIEHVNGYIKSIMKTSGVTTDYITSAGVQTLDGAQAVSYSRVRQTAGGDYKRTERMRTVLEAMVDKAKTLSLGQLNNFANTILPKVSTNMTAGDILSLIPKLASLNIDSGMGWPYEVSGATIGGVWYGVPVTLKSNVERLHKEFFGQEDYEVSEAVEEMNNAIINKTGYND